MLRRSKSSFAQTIQVKDGAATQRHLRPPMDTDDPAVRAAFRKGAQEVDESASIHLRGPELLAIEQ